MLTKIKTMSDKLKKVQGADNEVPQPTVPGKWKSPQTEAFHNRITLVENSYVCPFITTFSNFHCVYCEEMFIDPELFKEHTLSHEPRIYQGTIAYKRDLQIDIARINCLLCPQSIENLGRLLQAHHRCTRQETVS